MDFYHINTPPKYLICAIWRLSYQALNSILCQLRYIQDLLHRVYDMKDWSLQIIFVTNLVSCEIISYCERMIWAHFFSFFFFITAANLFLEK